MISVREIHKHYGNVRAVRGVSFQIPPRAVTGLLGPNGAGKSTTIRMITGFLPPDAGSITVDGLDARTQSLAVRRRIGYLPESAPAYPEMRTIDFLRYRAKLFGVPAPQRRTAIERSMTRCDLHPMARRRIGALSKGYRQRVGLAAAILHDPPVLILDEPTNGLDPVQIRAVRALIRELAEHKTVLVSSHILAEIERTCDRVVIMAHGTVRAEGRPDDLLAANAGARPVRVEARLPDPADLLTGLPGIATRRVEPLDEGWVLLTLHPDPDTDCAALCERLAARAAERRIPLREITRHRPTLEQAFLHAIETPAEPPAEPSRRPSPESEEPAA